MAAGRRARDPLFGTRWVHAFEEDTPAGAVYRPEGDDLPLARRPREAFELSADGSARLFRPGPADRPVEQAARWRREGGVVVIAARAGGAELRIVEQGPARLVVRAAGPER